MPAFFFNNTQTFPPVEKADEDGLLAIGGNLSVERLLAAYHNGIFPWYNEGEPVCWYCPDPRFVLFPREIIISKSLQQLLKKNEFGFTVNKDFTAVIRSCQQIKRAGQDGTWITEEIIDAYTILHKLGYAHSAEVWKDDELVGGLYGIKMGKVFFGESMFSTISNASKYAFARYVETLKTGGVE
jgi:leucyl/phenylalanyl-tRNA--protein transferase